MPALAQAPAQTNAPASGTATTPAATPATTPVWACPVSRPPPPIAELPDAHAPQRVPGSSVADTKAPLRNLDATPDWHPEAHAPKPVVVAKGGNPGALAAPMVEVARRLSVQEMVAAAACAASLPP